MIVEVYIPAMAVAGTLIHQPTGFAATLLPIRIAPMPVALDVSNTVDVGGELDAVVIATG